MSLPPGINESHVLEAINRYDAGVDHPFGAATVWELVHEGRTYPPKAIAGIAANLLTGRNYNPENISNGWGPRQACRVLDDLGFTVRGINGEAPPRRDWSDREVELVVADYFDMLQSEMSLQSFNKADHRRHLMDRLDNRSEGAVEFKHQNISAVLVGMGLPYVKGYKPRGNYQGSLVTGIEDYVRNHPGYFEQLLAAPAMSPQSRQQVAASATAGLFVSPPERVDSSGEEPRPWINRAARRTDFRRRDAENRALGAMGEEFVVALERRRLTEAGRDDLANRVEWSSRDVGDGLGYDVLSYDPADDSERWIEVKTTGLGLYFPFYLTRNEVRCSEDAPDRYRLYRVFDWAQQPMLYVLEGAMSQACDLTPTNYLARPAG